MIIKEDATIMDYHSPFDHGFRPSLRYPNKKLNILLQKYRSFTVAVTDVDTPLLLKSLLYEHSPTFSNVNQYILGEKISIRWLVSVFYIWILVEIPKL